MFTLRQYLTTLADTHGLTKTLGGMEVCRDSRGRMCYTVGNSAIVFRVRHEGHIRSLRCYMHPPRHLAEIYGERLLPQELYLYDSPRSGVWVDVVLGDWIEGATLHEAVAEAAAAEDATRLGQLAAAFDRLAARLTSDDWAHGDLKPENIVVDSSGRLHLIDLDAMYLPAFAGEASPELGTAAFQHPARTIRDFNASLDDYPAALISTALHALALDPTLYVRYPDADGLLFSPQQIRTDEALREAIALFEREGLAVQYRIARLLYAPTPRLFGLPELLAWAARTGGPPCGGREGEETTGNTGGDKSGDTDGGAERYPAGNTGCGADKHTGGGTRGIPGIQGTAGTSTQTGTQAAESCLRAKTETYGTTAAQFRRSCSSGTACGVTGHRSGSSYRRSTTADSTLPKGLPPSGWARLGTTSTSKGAPGYDVRGTKP